MAAVSEMFTFKFEPARVAYGLSIAAVSARFNFKSILLCTRLKESIMRCVLAYVLSIAAVSEMFTFKFKPEVELATVAYGLNMAAVSARFNFKSILLCTRLKESIIRCVLA